MYERYCDQCGNFTPTIDDYCLICMEPSVRIAFLKGEISHPKRTRNADPATLPSMAVTDGSEETLPKAKTA